MDTNQKPEFISGDRLYLREVRISDVNEDYYRWMNDPGIVQYTESRFSPQSMEQIAVFVRDMSSTRDNVFLAIMERSSGKHIGNIKLGGINWKHRFGDIGLIIGDKDCWGKGYGTEAISLVADFAAKTLNLHKVWAGCYCINEGSIKAFQKAGFTREGISKQQYFFNGDYIDAVILGKILD